MKSFQTIKEQSRGILINLFESLNQNPSDNLVLVIYTSIEEEPRYLSAFIELILRREINPHNHAFQKFGIWFLKELSKISRNFNHKPSFKTIISASFQSFSKIPFNFSDISLAFLYQQMIAAWKVPTNSHSTFQALVTRLKNQVNSLETILYLGGIAKVFEFQFKNEYRLHLKDALVEILKIIENKIDKEPIYCLFGLIFYKTFTYFDNKEIMPIEIEKWVVLAGKIIVTQQPIDNVEEIYEKANSEEYIFLEIKNIIYQICSRFLMKIGRIQKQKNNDKIFFQKYFRELFIAVAHDVKNPNYPQNIKKEQLKCLRNFISVNYEKIAQLQLRIKDQEMDNLFNQIILPFMGCSNREKVQIVSNPYDYVSESFNFMELSVRQAAIDCFSIIQSKKGMKNNFATLSLMLSANQNLAQIGLKVIDRAELKFKNLLPESARKIFEQITSFFEAVSPLIRFSALRAAVKFIKFIENSTEKLGQIETLYSILTKDESIAVRFAAGLAFVAVCETVKAEDAPFVGKLLREISYECAVVILKMTEEFQSEEAINGLVSLIRSDIFADNLAPLAPELFLRCVRLTHNLKQKVGILDEEEDKFVSAILAMDTCFETLQQLLNLMPNNQLKCQSSISKALSSLLCQIQSEKKTNEKLNDGNDNHVSLVSHYFYLVPKITQEWWEIFKQMIQSSHEFEEYALIINSTKHLNSHPDIPSFYQKISSYFSRSYDSVQDDKSLLFITYAFILENSLDFCNENFFLTLKNQIFTQMIKNLKIKKSKVSTTELYLNSIALIFYPEDYKTILKQSHIDLFLKTFDSKYKTIYESEGIEDFHRYFLLSWVKLFQLQSQALNSHNLLKVTQFAQVLFKKQLEALKKDCFYGAGVKENYDDQNNNEDEDQDEEFLEEFEDVEDCEMLEEEYFEFQKDKMYHKMSDFIDQKGYYIQFINKVKGSQIWKQVAESTKVKIDEALETLIEIEKIKNENGMNQSISKISIPKTY